MHDDRYPAHFKMPAGDTPGGLKDKGYHALRTQNENGNRRH